MTILTTITCKIPESMNLQLEAVSEERGISKSELFRESIHEKMRHQKKPAKISAYDVMKDGCGIIKSGPRDLATNPKHFKGYGRD